jgi:hypothetical protein
MLSGTLFLRNEGPANFNVKKKELGFWHRYDSIPMANGMINSGMALKKPAIAMVVFSGIIMG